jgi:hypothetical protein
VTGLVAMMVAAPATAGEAAGKVVSTSGEVQVVGADGQARLAAKNDVVNAGDTLATGNGRAQLQFADGGLVALRPGTQFRIDEYNYGGSEDGTERSWFSLLKGGFRAISGSIGHRNPQSYRVKTLVATIGIRGTVYDGEFCEAKCGDKPAGLHVSTVEGTINVSNEAGSLDIPAGSGGFVQDASTPPALVENDSPSDDDMGDSPFNEDPYKAGENINPSDIVVPAPPEPPPPPPPPPPPIDDSPDLSTF